MRITGIQQYAKRMEKLEAASGISTHIIWWDHKSELDQAAEITRFCETRPYATPQDTYIFVQWIAQPGLPTPPK
jgi:hypothetical protein